MSLDHHEIIPHLLCGAQPRNSQEVDHLKDEHGITCIISLQNDNDLLSWKVEWTTMLQQAQQRHMTYHRFPVGALLGCSNIIQLVLRDLCRRQTSECLQ